MVDNKTIHIKNESSYGDPQTSIIAPYGDLQTLTNDNDHPIEIKVILGKDTKLSNNYTKQYSNIK